jgi:choline monooxygenase
VRLDIHEDIRKASTPPSSFYTDSVAFEETLQKVFASSWQYVGDLDSLKVPGQAWPFTLLEGSLNEPLLLTRDFEDNLHCLSNVCTHRGNLVVEGPCVEKLLRCRYHGRRFQLDGTFHSMPEFEGCEGFPSEKDDLPRLPLEVWERFLFASMNPKARLGEWLRPMADRVGWLPLDRLVFDQARSRDYLVKAHWALYVENYLEAFHIPYVHAALNQELDYGQYRYEVYPFCNLQLGLGKPGSEAFDLPGDSPDRGETVCAYYWWLFPNTMFNFYPWGLSINVVKPLALDLTRVSFLTFVGDASRLGKGAGGDLDRVEREDEAIVELVQKGLRSRYYDRGRYSPKREIGTHHFHRILSQFLED